MGKTPQTLQTIKKRIPAPNNVLVDIYGVLTSWKFSKDLKEYITENLNHFLDRKFCEKTVVHIINKLRESAAIERSSGLEIPLIEGPDQSNQLIINSVVQNVLWQIENKHKTNQMQLDTLYNLIWADGYRTGRLKVHVFPDVKESLNKWRFHQFIKIYSYASGAREGQKLYLSSTTDGNLSTFFANHINSSGGYKYDPNKFKVVLSALREPHPENLLYITDEPRKAKAAIEAGLRAIVVLREGNTKYSEEELKDLTTIRSFNEIEFESDPSNEPCC